MLVLEGLSAWHGAAQALFNVSLQVGPGELVLLQGLNGAGKSTLLQAVMGLLPRVQGGLLWQGRPLQGLAPHARAQAGLGYVPEDRRLFGELTVLQNLMVARRAPLGERITAQQQRDQVLELFPLLQALLPRQAQTLSGGEQQMLALARTLMTAPRLLLLDEPCEGIAPVLVQAMREALLALKAQGMAMLIAEQNAVLRAHADRVITLVAGHTGTPSTP